ncbi:hypothetical protein KXR83_00800 [Williamsia muralis]|uniref:hypothetical protein n=1 Tax=Williamsia marianensis TaxID=85044 RepID=UPI003F160BB2
MARQLAPIVTFVHEALGVVGLTLPMPTNPIITAPADLQDAQKLSRRALLDHRQPGFPRPCVLAELRFHVATNADTARTQAAPVAHTLTGRLNYIGTPGGLAGLICDIKAAHVADGVRLIPACADDDDALDLIVNVVMPLLTEHGSAMDTASVGYIHKIIAQRTQVDDKSTASPAGR